MSYKKYTARDYAEWCHRGQKRKDTGEPYFNHLERVASNVVDYLFAEDRTPPYSYYGVNAYQIIDAAYLHDILEDTKVTYVDLAKDFGKTTADLVMECTNVYTPKAFPKFNRKQRKHLECIRLGNISKAAQLIKRCDMADNIGDYIIHNPKYAAKYMAEKIEVLKEFTR